MLHWHVIQLLGLLPILPGMSCHIAMVNGDNHQCLRWLYAVSYYQLRVWMSITFVVYCFYLLLFLLFDVVQACPWQLKVCLLDVCLMTKERTFCLNSNTIWKINACSFLTPTIVKAQNFSWAWQNSQIWTIPTNFNVFVFRPNECSSVVYHSSSVFMDFINIVMQFCMSDQATIY